jgi:hypothetical protein
MRVHISLKTCHLDVGLGKLPGVYARDSVAVRHYKIPT